MRNFNLRELLEFKPEEGIISLKESRMVLLHVTALAHLKYELICSLGKDIAQGVLYRFGYRCGMHDAKMIAANYGKEMHFIDLGPIIYQWKGNGQVKIIKELRFGPDLSRYHVEGRWENSHEAEQFVQNYGQAGHPVCWISTGYASGFSSIFAGQEMICVEKTCAGMGHQNCIWEMRTSENWGNFVNKDLYNINFTPNFKNLQTMMAEQKSVDLNRKMTRLMLEGKGVQQIAESLSNIVDSQVVVFDCFLNIPAMRWIGISNHIQIDILRQNLQEYLSKHIPEKGNPQKQLETKTITRLSYWMENYEQQSWIIAPIMTGTKCWGYLLVKEESEFAELNLLAIEHASTLCALDYLKQESSLEVELRLKGDLLGELFSGEPELKQVQARAMKLGFDLNKPHQIYVVDIIKPVQPDPETGIDDELFEFIKADMNNLINRLSPGSLVALRKNRIVVVLNISKQDDQAENSALFPDLTRVWVQKNLTGYAANIVWGRLCTEFSDYRYSFDEAWKAADILKDLGKNNVTTSFADLGIYAILWESGNKQQLKEYALSMLSPLLLYDQEHNSNLLWTLELFLEHKCGFSETAKAAYLHINTLRYRLKRVEELTGLDLSRNEDRFQAQLSIRLLKILGHYHG